MGSRKHISRKDISASAFTPKPKPNILQTRAFSSGKHARSSELPKTDILQTRPFSTPSQKGSEPEVQPLPPESLEKASAFGFNGASIPLFAPEPVAPIQAKLTVGEAGDKYEQEADAMAAEVVNRMNTPQSQESGENQTVQQKEDNQPKISPKPIVQPQSDAGGIAASPDLETSIEGKRGSGEPLAQSIREPMEGAFGADFSGVKVHRDSQSDELNKSIQAKAFTTGQDIFFREGEYDPGSRGGQELIAHELTHVVQQKGDVIQRVDEPPPTKMTTEQIKHANRIRKARGLPLLPLPQTTTETESSTNSSTVESDSTSTSSSSLTETLENVPTASSNQVQAVPQTIEQLAESLETSIDEWVDNDDTLLEILLGPLEANWFIAKDCLTMDKWPSSVPKQSQPSHQKSIKLMQALVDMRGRKWDAFAKETIPGIKQEVERIAREASGVFDTTKNELAASSVEKLEIGEAVGSQSVTSDLDLSLKGNNTEIGVGLINRAFREKFGVPFDPGTVFDINVYSLDWMHGQTEVTQDKDSPVAIFNPEPEKRGELTNEKDKQERADTLEIWSLVKVRRNMTEPQWRTYENTILQSIPDPGARAAMDKKLIEAEFEYNTFDVMVKTKLEAMDAELKKQEEELGYQSTGHDKHLEEARGMRASNAIYQEIILQVRDIRLRLDKLRGSKPQDMEAIVNLSKQLAYKIAEGLTYANEVYATEGSVLHTVYGKQGAKKKVEKLKGGDQDKNIAPRPNVEKVKFNLTPEHYLQSVNENVGDSLHSLNHYHNQPHYAVYRAGKYLERLCEAADFLLTEQKAAEIPHYQLLKEIGLESVRAKNAEAGKDPIAVYTDTYFGDFTDPVHLDALMRQITTFGAKVSATFHSKKTGMEKFEQQLLPQTEQTSQDHIAQLNPQQPQVNGGSEELSKIQNYLEQIEQLINKPGND